MGRKKLNAFEIDPCVEISKASLKKINIDDFRNEVLKYAQITLTESEYRMLIKGEEILTKIGLHQPVDKNDGMLIIEMAKMKKRKFTLEMRKTIENYIDQHNLKSLF